MHPYSKRGPKIVMNNCCVLSTELTNSEFEMVEAVLVHLIQLVHHDEGEFGHGEHVLLILGKVLTTQTQRTVISLSQGIPFLSIKSNWTSCLCSEIADPLIHFQNISLLISCDFLFSFFFHQFQLRCFSAKLMKFVAFIFVHQFSESCFVIFVILS